MRKISWVRLNEEEKNAWVIQAENEERKKRINFTFLPPMFNEGSCLQNAILDIYNI